jgi:hypothetical protein
MTRYKGRALASARGPFFFGHESASRPFGLKTNRHGRLTPVRRQTALSSSHVGRQIKVLLRPIVRMGGWIAECFQGSPAWHMRCISLSDRTR